MENESESFKPAPTSTSNNRPSSKARKTSEQRTESKISTQELDSLKFSNPGKQMKELDFNWPEGNLTRNYRRQLASIRDQNLG